MRNFPVFDFYRSLLEAFIVSNFEERRDVQR